jgi:hypothetical protein
MPVGQRHALPSIAYHRDMARLDLYLKVELDLEDKERPDRIAQEICRAIRRVYGVRHAEVSNTVEKEN